jgi:hypothetical protein
MMSAIATTSQDQVSAEPADLGRASKLGTAVTSALAVPPTPGTATTRGGAPSSAAPASELAATTDEEPAARLVLSPSRPGSFAHLQVIDDAIDFRRARLAISCPDCQPGARCDDHGCDVELLRVYHQMARAAADAVRSTSAQEPYTPHTPVPDVGACG